MIEAPHHSRPCSPREEECRLAIEPATLALLRGTHAPFVDFVCLLHAILPAAMAAGWQEHEVEAALDVLVADLRTTGPERTGPRT